MVRQARVMAVVGAFLIGCAVLASHSRGAAAAEDRCEGTRPIKWLGALYTTNDVPGCPNGGLLSGTDQPDYLVGKKGEDEVRGLGASDELHGGYGSDVIYGGPGGWDFLDGYRGDDVLYGGDGRDDISGVEGEDVLYGGDGSDYLDGRDEGVKDTQRDELYCGAGRDKYIAGRLDYVSSSCEEGKLVDTGGSPLILLACAALLLGSGLMTSRYVMRRAS